MNLALRALLVAVAGVGLSGAPAAQAADTRPPTTPTDVRVGEVTPTTVQLRFGLSSDDTMVNGYIVRGGPRDEYAGDGLAFIQQLEPGATYTFTVAAYDAAGNESAPSDPVTVTLPEFQPPANVRVTSQARGTVSLAWEAPPNMPSASTYQVSVDGRLEIVTPATSGTVRHVAPGTHQLTVRAYDWREVLTPPSAAATVSVSAVADRTPPSAPTGFTAAFNRDTCLYDAHWNASRDDVDDPSALVYDVLSRDRITGGLYVSRYDHATTSVSNSSFDIAGVRAVDSAGNASAVTTGG
jgi:hypothetical protein